MAGQIPPPPPGFVPVSLNQATPSQPAVPPPPPGFVPVEAPRMVSDEIRPGGQVEEMTGKPKRLGDGLKPYFGGHNPVAEVYDLATNALDPRSSRNVVDRAADTVNFATSVPFRAFRLPAPADAAAELGYDGLQKSEQRFVENNGHLLKGLEAAGAASLASSRGQGFMQPTIPVQRNPIASARATAVADDIAAFDRADVRPFGPAFNQGPVASVGKQLSETPFIGGSVKNALDQSIFDTAAAVDRTATNMGQGRTFDQTGATITQGLERYRGAGLQALEPDVVQGMGINPRSAIAADTAMSAGARQAAATAAPIRAEIGANTTQTTRGQTFAAGRETQPREMFLTRRTNVEELDTAALNTVVRSPAAETSFATRAEALYEQAWRNIPALQRSNGSANANMLSPTNTRQALAQIDGQIANNIAGQSMLGGELVERLRNPRSNITLDDMRAIRTEIGRSLGNSNPLQQTLSRQQLNSLYGSISRDIEIGLETMANRAAIATQNTGANTATIEQARQAASALRSFRTADRYFRAGMGRIENVQSLLQATHPERAAQRLMDAALEGGRGNIGLIGTVRGALRPDEWGDFSSLVLRQLGQPTASARGVVQEAGFSVSSFSTKWNKMDPRARAALFDGPHRQAIDDIVRVSSRLAEVEATANTSRSATNAMNMTALGGVGAAIVAGDGGLTAFGTALAGGGAAVLMSRPAYARWMAEYTRLRAQSIVSRNPTTWQLASHAARLVAMAANDHDPEVKEVAAAVLKETGAPQSTRAQRQPTIQTGTR